MPLLLQFDSFSYLIRVAIFSAAILVGLEWMVSPLDSLALLMLTLPFSPRVAGGDGPSTCTGCLQMTQAIETSIVLSEVNVSTWHNLSTWHWGQRSLRLGSKVT